MTTQTLHNDVYSALMRGAAFGEVLAIVLLHKARGVGQRETYETLECVRIELGCSAEEYSPACEILEGIMDRVWGYCSVADLIWETPLSR